MNSTLEALIKNKIEGRFGVPDPDNKQQETPKDGKAPPVPIDRKIHGYIYVYDCSTLNTFETLLSLISTVRNYERSEGRGKKEQAFTPLKMVLANKFDLLPYRESTEKIKKEELSQLEIKKHKFVSALSNQGVSEAFRSFIEDIHAHSILSKEMNECEKSRLEKAGGESSH